MKTLDRYIIRQFLLNFAILFAVVMTLFVVVDFIINQDEFFQAGRVRADRWGGVIPATLYSVFDYYAPMVVLAYVFFVGLLAVGAMGFTLASLERSRELVAMVAGGLSLYRVAAPVLLTSAVLIALILPIQELVIPPLAGKLARGPSEVKNESLKSFRVVFARDERGNLLSAARFNPDDGRLDGVSILLRDESRAAYGKIKADLAVWDDTTQAWRFPTTGYLISVRGPASPDRAAVGGATTGEPEPVDHYRTELSPTVLTMRRSTLYSRLLSLSWLQRMQDAEVLAASQRSEVTRVMWSRFSLVAVHILLVAITLPFFLVLQPGSMLVQGVKAAGIGLAAWGASLVALQVAPGGINPVTAAWLPVVVLVPVAAATLQTVRT